MKAILILVTACGLLLAGVAQAVTCANNIPASNPDSVYVDHGDGTLTDTRTGLMWKQCSEGQTGSTCATGSAADYTWPQALAHAEAHTFAGHADWRLPNLRELHSLVEDCRSYPAINDTRFPNTPSSYFWSGSPNADGSGSAWGVHFGYGGAYSYYRGYGVRVRLVRGGQSFDNLGVAGSAAVGFVSENLPDGTFLLGSATKTWTFTNGTAAISGLKAVRVSADGGLGISQAEIAVGDVAANASFTVSLPIAPEHAGDAVKSSYWKLVDGSGNPVAISNSRTGQFWLKLRTNRAPTFSARQATTLGAAVDAPVTLALLGEDADGDALSYSVVSGGGSISGNTWSGSFADTGINNLQQLVLRVSDGKESTQKTFHVVLYDGSGLSHFFADQAPSTNPNSVYAATHFLAGKGITLGCSALESGQRIFCYGDKVNQAEALKLLLLAAKARGLVTLDAPYSFANDQMVTFDAAANSYADYSWAATYAVTAFRLGMIDDLVNWNPAAPVTRLQLAQWVTHLLNLTTPLALLKAKNMLDVYQLADAADFASAADYSYALQAAFFGYLGSLGGTFAPATEMTRGDFAVVAARVLRTPTIDGLNLTASGGGALAETPPSIAHGQTLSINGVKGLAISEILMSGERVLEDWIEPRENYVRIGVALSDGRSLGPMRYIRDLATTPITLDTSMLNLNTNASLSLIVLLDSHAPEGADMVRSNVARVVYLPLVVNFPDRDGDGVRDDLDLWPDHALYSVDANGNGIPDSADTALGISDRSGSESIVVNGVQTTLIQALLEGNFAQLYNTLKPLPAAPALVSAAPGNGSAALSFSAPTSNGGGDITGYSAYCGNFTAEGNASPITVAGLVNGTTYNCVVAAINANGTGPVSNALAVTPSAGGAVISLAPGTLTFASLSVGNTSAAQIVTLTNTGAATLAISGISIAGDFGQSNNCGTTLVVGGSCSISVLFLPTAAGSRTGTLTIASNAPGSPHSVGLSGTGQGASGAITANLVTGWNLLGNGTSAAITVATPFGDADKITSVWKWLPADGGQWAFYTPTMADGGAVYAAGKGYAYLSSIGSGEGFWVNAKAPFTASLGSASLLAATAFRDGSGPGEANILPSGWSLIAVGDGPTPRGFANSIQSPYAPPPAPGTPAATTLTSLWAWYPGDATHAAGWYFYAPTLDNSGGLANYITGKGYLDFGTQGKTLDPTTGFWVNRP